MKIQVILKLRSKNPQGLEHLEVDKFVCLYVQKLTRQLPMIADRPWWKSKLRQNTSIYIAVTLKPIAKFFWSAKNKRKFIQYSQHIYIFFLLYFTFILCICVVLQRLYKSNSGNSGNSGWYEQKLPKYVALQGHTSVFFLIC